nr:hypothetical protein [Tanacetum cinerariifolium]
MLGLLDVHWSLKFARLIHGFLLTIKSRCVALKLFNVMKYWDKYYVPEPEYPEYLVPSPGYVADSDPKEDPEEDPKEDPVDYPADGGDDDDDDEEEEDNEDSEEDEEKEEHLALADTTILPAIDPIPAPPLPLPSPPTHTSPTYAHAPLGYRAAMIRSRAASPSTHHPSEIPSPPLLLPSTTHREDIPEADMSLQKMAYFTAPTCRFEVGESSAHAARQPRSDVTHKTNYSFVDIVDVTPGRPMSREVGYGIMDVWLDMVGDMEGRAPTTLEELSQRVTDLAATLAQDTHGIYEYDRTREPEPARDPEPQDGQVDAGSS